MKGQMKSLPDNTRIINQTQKWLRAVVIEHNLCPFAKREYENETIHYAVIREMGLERQLEQVIKHCTALDEDGNRETSLLIFPEALSDFDIYLDVLAAATALLKDLGYEGIYQLASFHPDYRFEGTDINVASNYTNRSPYPMLHILREASIETALENYPNPEKIPERNIKRTQELGLKVMQDLLARCYE